MSEPPDRPDPDALLLRVKEEEARKRRGKLKIFFGFAPGVGKTYRMLQVARDLVADQKQDVVVGLVETHRRRETASLVLGLELLPRRKVEHRGRVLEEFDLDAALARRPALVIVDELAHTNAPGCRHPKRWQDIEELLAAGIDVFTTMNVQHLESLNDVIAQITRVQVRETVPDSVVDRADAIELVDIAPEELLHRLKEGKVYLEEQARRAANHFFQSLAAIGAKRAVVAMTGEMYDEKHDSALLGSRLCIFAHDETIIDIPEHGVDADDVADHVDAAARRQAAVMVEQMKTVVPDVAIKAEPALMRYWSKDAKEKQDEKGRYIPWD